MAGPLIMTGEPLLTVEAVSKHFGGVTALANVSLTLHEGEVLGLIGPNGAGKSTLFNVISGVEPPSGGAIHLASREITGQRADRICRAGIARTFQAASLLPGMTCWENVHVASLFCRPESAAKRSAAARTEAALDLCGLLPLAHADVGEITTGEAKRLEIARAIATEPHILMTDEAVAGLNLVETDQVIAILRKVNAAGVAILFVEHDVRAVLALVQRLVVLAQGEVLAEGAPTVVARRPEVIEAYLGSRYAQAQ